MKIHSSFRDYYDTARGFGIDPNVHYIRKSEIVSQKGLKSKWGALQTHGHRSATYSLYFCWIGFCGRLYLFCEKETNRFSVDKTRVILYNEDALAEFSHITWKKACDEALKIFSTSDDSYFLELGCPVFVVGGFNTRYNAKEECIEKNPQLIPYHFAKVMPPFEAFQNLSMYLGNNLAKQNDPKPLDDKYRIQAHGFDKYSFRNTLPPTRKR